MKTVTTRAELDGLPVKSVVIDTTGNAWQLRSKRSGQYAEWAIAMRMGGLSTSVMVAARGPLTVAWEPEEEK